MAQWINILRNNSFINLPRLPFLCEKTEAVPLAQPGSYGRQAGRQTGSQANEILEIFKIIYWMKYWKFISVQKGTV